MQKIFILEMVDSRNGYVNVSPKSHQALKQELSEGWNVIGATTVLTNKSNNDIQVTSQIVYVLEKINIPKIDMSQVKPKIVKGSMPISYASSAYGGHDYNDCK